MLKKAFLALAVVLSAPALVSCAASGSASVGDEDAAAGSTAGDADTRSTTGSTPSSTTRSTTTTTTTTDN